MIDQANILRGLVERSRSLAPSTATPVAPVSTARVIAITSGKGGVGRSHVALNLSVALAEAGHRTALLDASPGTSGPAVLCGLDAYWNLEHVVAGNRTLADVTLEGPAGTRIVPGGHALGDLVRHPVAIQRDVVGQLEALERTHDYLVVDTGGTRAYATCADTCLVVTTPEPTAIMDGYATIKSLLADDGPDVEILVNRSESTETARAIIDRIRHTSRAFLGSEVGSAGYVPEDPAIGRAVIARAPFVTSDSNSPASRAILGLARRVHNLSTTGRPRGRYFPTLQQRLERRTA